MSEEHVEANLAAWNLRTGVHASSEFYDVEGFLSGNSTLHKTELDLLPDVNGKKLLHLQCHFGLDTLSWARRGAIATGVDLSTEAIEKARLLSSQIGSNAEFYDADVQKIGDRFKGEFDIVYSSYGVLCWLKDLDAWANGIRSSLKLGGRFILVEYHPILDVVCDGYLSGRNQYFPSTQAMLEKSSGTYTDKNAPINYVEYRWPHSLSEILLALKTSGMEIKEFNEYPYSPYKLFPSLTVKKDGVWYEESDVRIPYLFSLVMQAKG